MKNNFLKPFIVLSLILTTIFSCGEDDTTIPDVDENEPDTNNSLLYENFESITETNEIIALEGWKNVNISSPQLYIRWDAQKTNDNIYAEIKKGGTIDKYDTWLVTKEIQIKNSRTLKLKVDINVNSRNSDNLQVFIVDDVTGDDISFFDNLEIDIVPSQQTDGFISKESTFTIPNTLSVFRIGFRYAKKSSTPSSTEYQIDNILITEE